MIFGNPYHYQVENLLYCLKGNRYKELFINSMSIIQKIRLFTILAKINSLDKYLNAQQYQELSKYLTTCGREKK